MTLRADTAGLILQLEKQIEEKRIELVHLDSVIRQIGDGEIDPETIPTRQRFPRRSQWFRHGEVTEITYDVLKELPNRGSVPVREIVDHAMRQKGFDPEHDRNLRHDFTNRFLVQLRALTIRGTVEKIGRGKGVKWRLAKKRRAG